LIWPIVLVDEKQHFQVVQIARLVEEVLELPVKIRDGLVLVDERQRHHMVQVAHLVGKFLVLSVKIRDGLVLGTAVVVRRWVVRFDYCADRQGNWLFVDRVSKGSLRCELGIVGRRCGHEDFKGEEVFKVWREEIKRAVYQIAHLSYMRGLEA